MCGWSDQSRPIPHVTIFWSCYFSIKVHNFSSPVSDSVLHPLVTALWWWPGFKTVEGPLRSAFCCSLPPMHGSQDCKTATAGFGASWSEDKWQASPGEMLSLEKGTSKGTALLHLFAEGNAFWLFSANLTIKTSQCLSVSSSLISPFCWYFMVLVTLFKFLHLLSLVFTTRSTRSNKSRSFYFSFSHSNLYPCI